MNIMVVPEDQATKQRQERSPYALASAAGADTDGQTNRVQCLVNLILKSVPLVCLPVHRLTNLDWPDLALREVFQQCGYFAWRPGECWESAEVHRDHLLGIEQAAS
jgi:hypothetical protein